MRRVARAIWPAVLLGVLLVAALPTVVRAQADYTHMTTRAGDFYVLISRLNGDDAWSYVDGVYRFRRAETGDDNSYTRCLLGVEPDPLTASPTATMGDVGYCYGLSVDKFNRVYFLEDQSGGWKDLFSRDTDGNPVFHQGTPGTALVTYTPWNCNGGATAASTEYNAGRLYIIRPDGTEGWFDGAYLRTQASRYKPAGNAETYEPGATSPRPFSDAPNASKLYPFVGSSDPRDVILPHPVNAKAPYDQFSYHSGGCITKGYLPFPTSGNNVNIPVGYWWIDDEVADPHGAGDDVGFRVKRMDSYKFIATRMHMSKYLDHPDYAAIFGVLNGGHRATDGSALYTAVGTDWLYTQSCNCGDTCMNAPVTDGGTSPPARAKIVFSTYGNSLDEERIYGVKSYGDLTPVGTSGPTDPEGHSELLRFVKNSSTGDWDATVIYPHPSNPKPSWVKLLNDGAEGWSPGWTAGFADNQFRSVGISAATSTHEWVYLSTVDPDRFCVSESFFRMGGTLWTLNSATGDVSWQERNDVTATYQSGTRNVGAADEITDIAADGLNYVYVLKTDIHPSDAEITAEDALIEGGTAANRYTDSRFYVETMSDDGQVIQLKFKQEVGKKVLKGGFEGSMNEVGFAPKGVNYWTRSYRYVAGEYPVGWVESAFSMIGTPVDQTVRSEIAAVNIAMPPAQGSVFLDIMVYESSGAASPIIRPQDRVAFPDGNKLTIEADTDGGLGTYANYVFNLENLPSYGTLMRAPYGYMVANYSAEDEDQDGRGGSFVYGLIWPSAVDNSGAGVEVKSDEASYQLRYAWRIRDVTQYEDKPKKDATDFNEAALTAEYLQWDGTDAATMATRQWNGGALDEGHAWFLAEEAPAPGQPITVRGITMPAFKDPGRYEIVFKMKGGFWDIPVLQDFNQPIMPEAEVFNAETKFVVEVKPGDPQGDSFVYDLEVVSDETGGAGESYKAIPEDTASSVYCKGVVKWFGGKNYDDSAAAMAKTSGAGSWNYTWNYGGRIYPNNWDFTDPQVWTDGADLTVRNDGDGDWGTRYDYTPGVDADADMLPQGGEGDDPQRLHDWFGIKYCWELTYLREQLVGGVPTPTPVTVDYRWGTLAELHVLQKSPDVVSLKSRLLGGRDFLEAKDASAREYYFRIPLMDANDWPTGARALEMKKLFDATQGDSTYLSWDPKYALLRPRLGSVSFGDVLTQPTWYVPTTPAFVQMTCRVWYPRVSWVPAHDPKAADPTLPTAVLYSDETGTGGTPTPLYFTLKDDPCPPGFPGRREFVDPVSGDPSVTTVALWPGRYKSGRFEPQLDDGLGNSQNVFTAGADGDEYYELRIDDVTRPHIYGASTKSGDDAPPLNPADSGDYTGCGGSYEGELGKTVDRDLYALVRDNNPYIHWNDHTGLDVRIEYPLLTDFCVETGDDPRNAEWGVGLHAASSGGYGDVPTFGFDISAGPSGDFKDPERPDWPGDPVARPRPLPSGTYWRVTPDRISPIPDEELPGGMTGRVGFNNQGGDSPFPDFQGAASQFNGPASGMPYEWNKEAVALGNWRMSTYERDRRYLPLPIFVKGVDPSAGTTSFSLLAKGEAIPQGDAVSEDICFTDGDTDTPSSSRREYTRFADILARDNVAPHLSVEIRIAGATRRLFFDAYNDYARDFGVDAGASLDESNYVIVKRSVDDREIVGAVSEALGTVTTSDFLDWALPSHALTEGTTSTERLASKVDFTQAAVTTTPPAASQPFQPAPMDPERFTVNIEEDAQFTLLVRACDNASDPRDIRLAVHGGAPGATNQNPLPAVERTNVVDRLALLTASHSYPRENQEDVVTVEARDAAGNTREVKLKFRSYAHEIDFRVISDRIRRQK